MLSNFNVPHGLSFCKFKPQNPDPTTKTKCNPNCNILMTNLAILGGNLHIKLPMAKSCCCRLIVLAFDKGSYNININVDGP
jgi:hypothetical protein